MTRKIQSALISVFNKDGLENIIRQVSQLGITIYSTGGTQTFIEKLGIAVIPVEEITSYPSILGGRVKTLHPSVFGGILGKREDDTHVEEMKEFKIPAIDLVIVDLYPFEETLKAVNDPAFRGREQEKHAMVIEKIDIGGPSMIRAAAKNYKDVMVVAAKKEYKELEQLLSEQKGETTIEQRRSFAAKAFEVVAHYDVAIAKYFTHLAGQAGASPSLYFIESITDPAPLRYGENPHQSAVFYGRLDQFFEQLNGKELSYNNLVDVDAALQLINEFKQTTFAIIKHTNVCGVAQRDNVKDSWDAALAGDPESAFGGVLICNAPIDKNTADAINNIFFEVLIAPAFDEEALTILRSKKNRILLKQRESFSVTGAAMYRSLLNGVLVQQTDQGNFSEWKEVGGVNSGTGEKEDLEFANLICKHLKSNAIALVKDRQLIGKGCGQTSRIDSLRQALDKAKQFRFDLTGAVMASDAFFPFDDCVKMGHEAGIAAFIQPGGSIRDNDSINYCTKHKLAMVITGTRHFRH